MSNPSRSGKKTFIALQTANCLHKLVTTPRFGRLPCKKQTRRKDSRLQAIQDTVIKGVIPLADLTGKVSESFDSGSAMPTKEVFWKGLSNSLFSVAAENRSLNICHRDMFKTDLDDNCKALCNNKHPSGNEVFGDDYTERLKTVSESNKAAKQLRRSNKLVSQKYRGSSNNF